MPKTLEQLIGGLSEERVELLAEMANSLRREISSEVAPDSDIVTAKFDQDFSGRLLLFHAMHDAALTKKTFEFFFCGASRAAGRTAVLTGSGVHPGEDAVIDGQKFSLKTEGSKSIRRTEVHISKLMEASWIREGLTTVDLCRLARERIGAHLSHYERILTLRSFQDGDFVEYELVEIPHEILLRVAALAPAVFSSRTPKGSSSATVRNEQGEAFFVLSLDGSVEKVTVRRLDIRRCKVHARWRVNLRLAAALAE